MLIRICLIPKHRYEEYNRQRDKRQTDDCYKDTNKQQTFSKEVDAVYQCIGTNNIQHSGKQQNKNDVEDKRNYECKQLFS